MGGVIVVDPARATPGREYLAALGHRRIARVPGLTYLWHTQERSEALQEAVAGVSVAYEMGVVIPRRLSMVAWDDSPLCQLTHPQLSAVSRDIAAFGAHAADRLLRVVAGEEVGSFEDATPVLIPRGSTAPPRAN